MPRLVDEHGNDVPDGEIGELLVRGPSAAEGYWNQRDKTRRTFAGEWTRTGDKYMRGGGRLLPLLRAHRRHVQGERPVGVAVRGRIGAGEPPARARSGGGGRKRTTTASIKPKAFIVLKDGASDGDDLREALKEHVKQQVGLWKYPRWIEIVRSAAEDGDRQDPAVQAEGLGLAARGQSR